MSRVILDVSFHDADGARGRGGWIIPKLLRQTSCGQVHISPHFESLQQIETQIDRMQADLEEIRMIARERFASDRAGAVQPRHKAIAVVDDDEAVRHALKFMLQTAGHYVETFTDAEAFLESDIAKFAKLIFDQNMPGLSGLELAARLRAEGIRTPIMLVTSAPSPAISHRAAELGVDYVLEKSADADALLSFVSAPEKAPDMHNALCLHLRDKPVQTSAGAKTRTLAPLRSDRPRSGPRFQTV